MQGYSADFYALATYFENGDCTGRSNVIDRRGLSTMKYLDPPFKPRSFCIPENHTVELYRYPNFFWSPIATIIGTFSDDVMHCYEYMPEMDEARSIKFCRGTSC